MIEKIDEMEAYRMGPLQLAEKINEIIDHLNKLHGEGFHMGLIGVPDVPVVTDGTKWEGIKDENKA